MKATFAALLALVALGPGSLLAEEVKTATQCVVPEFSFQWPDHRSPVLVTTAEKETTYRVWVLQQPGANELTRGWLRRAKGAPGYTEKEPRNRSRSQLARTCWPDGFGPEWTEADEDLIRDYESYYPRGSRELIVTADSQGTPKSVNLVCFPHLFVSPHVLVEYEVVGSDGKTLPRNSEVPDACRTGTTGPVPVFDKHLIRFDVGSVFALGDSGSFENNAELAVTSTSKWSRKVTGVVDIRFSELGNLEEQADTTDGQEPANGDGAAGGDDGGEPPAEGDDQIFSPFLKGGSFLRANAYLAFHPWRWPAEVGGNRVGRSQALIVGGGFSTVPGETPDFADAKLRYFAGIRFQIIGFNRGRPGSGLEDSFGFFQFGYARDKLWRYEEGVETEVDGETVTTTRERDEQDRFFLESEIEIPRLGTKSLRLVLRGFADLPTSGSGPADVRVSALVGVKPDQLAGIFGQ